MFNPKLDKRYNSTNMQAENVYNNNFLSKL